MLTRGDGLKRKIYVDSTPRSVLPRLPPKPIEHPKGDLWEIESVLRKKHTGSAVTYLVKWLGFPLSEASWIPGPLPSAFRRHSTSIDLVSSDSDSDSDADSDAEKEADAKAFKPTNPFVDDTESDSEMGSAEESDSEVDVMESDDEVWPPVVQRHARWGHPPVEQADEQGGSSEVEAAAVASESDSAAPAAVHYVTIDLVIPQASGSVFQVSFNVSVDGA